MSHLLEPIINATLDALNWGGVWAVFLLMLVESACIPAPSEVIMLFAGYMVWKHDATLLQVVVAGVAGNVIGSWVAWGIGASGGYVLLERHGKWLHIGPRQLQWAHLWFERYGARTVFFTRMLPIIRTFISLPAGIARMPLGRFTIYTLLGCIPWVTALALIGLKLGPKWEQAHEVLHYADYLVVLAVVGAIVWYLMYRSRRGRANAANTPD